MQQEKMVTLTWIIACKCLKSHILSNVKILTRTTATKMTTFADVLEDFDREVVCRPHRGAASGGDKLAAIKRVIARTCHPDFFHGTESERAVRAAVFKEIWPEIRRIEGA